MLRFLFIILTLFFLNSSSQGRVMSDFSDKAQQDKQYVLLHHDAFDNILKEQQAPLTSAVRSDNSSQRVNPSRTIRLLPTNGNNPNRCNGRCSNYSLYNHPLYATRFLCHAAQGMSAGVASPRSYYVITLRRLLC